MIDAPRLLTDLKRLRRTLDADLRLAHASGAAREAVQAEYDGALGTGRTRDTFAAFLDGAFDQAAVHWVLACVFLRFLEDNGLVDRPLISGPGERLELAKQRQDAYFRAKPHDSDTGYLLSIFEEVARLPGLSGLFDPEHNPLFRLPLSGDGAMALLRFFREVQPETGTLAHDFTDPEWDTRFLGDLYQDLSEVARKRYALLQTPEFVESWILDRTLEPAIREFGHETIRVIDPACGSGHFLLGGFARVLQEWQRSTPNLPPAAQAQRALESVAGVDLNPFAVEIARFRLLVAALSAAGVAKLSAAPNFRMRLATGDSLLHGRHFFRRELGGAEEGFGRVLRHHYAAEDAAEVDRILGQQYHAVVGNPPYITPKDAAMRDAYREIYVSCHMKYGLGAPFTERFFDLAQTGDGSRAAGFVGLIVANSFMKREFGSKLIEDVLPRLDLTHIVDCSGAYIPGHGTPTAILLGRNRAPVAGVVRTVRGIRGEPGTPADPAHGLVWSAIIRQADLADSVSAFISTEDTSREALSRHPWNMGGGGAADLQEKIEAKRPRLSSIASEIGITSVSGEDDIFTFEDYREAKRLGIHHLHPLVVGDKVRDFRVVTRIWAVWPHSSDFKVRSLCEIPDVARHLWLARTVLSKRKRFGTPMLERGLTWYEFQELYPSKLRTSLTITLAFVATHNHFVLERGGGVFKQSAPVIKLSDTQGEEDYLKLLALLNSSTACFWLKQVSQNRGATIDDRGARQRTSPFEDFYEFPAGVLSKFPLAMPAPYEFAKVMDCLALDYAEAQPIAVCAGAVPTRDALDSAHVRADRLLSRMIAMQEELDWRCYGLYGLHDAIPECSEPPPLRLGERAFEIAMARRVAADEIETTWFERHGSEPVVDLPDDWSTGYRSIVERRIALIQNDSAIGLIERPEYKRRWVTESWEEMERSALRIWLLDRLEAAPFWPADDPRLLSTNQLTDLVRRDADFVSVAELYTGRSDVPLETLIAELVTKQAVPFVAALRYTETGLRKREQWEEVWNKQRQEDAIDAKVEAERDHFLPQAQRRAQERWCNLNPPRADQSPEAYAVRMAGDVAPIVEQEVRALVAEEQRRRKAAQVGTIPVPPKYVARDFQLGDFWRLRNGLDVPKERFVSFPHCQRDADGSLVITWAGYNHVARARAIATYYLERKEGDGWPPERLVPLLTGLIELLPWLCQWHNEYDSDTGVRMGDYFAEFVREEARALGMTEAAVAAWTPPAVARRGRGRRRVA